MHHFGLWNFKTRVANKSCYFTETSIVVSMYDTVDTCVCVCVVIPFLVIPFLVILFQIQQRPSLVRTPLHWNWMVAPHWKVYPLPRRSPASQSLSSPMPVTAQ